MEVVNKYDVIVIEDNFYGEIRFILEFLFIFKFFDIKDKVLYFGLFLKVLCLGFRVVWMCGNVDIIDKVEFLK